MFCGSKGGMVQVGRVWLVVVKGGDINWQNVVGGIKGGDTSWQNVVGGSKGGDIHWQNVVGGSKGE